MSGLSWSTGRRQFGKTCIVKFCLYQAWPSSEPEAVEAEAGPADEAESSSSIWPLGDKGALSADTYIARNMPSVEVRISECSDEQRKRARDAKNKVSGNRDWLAECKHLLS